MNMKRLLLLLSLAATIAVPSLMLTPVQGGTPTGTVAVTFTCKWSHTALDDPIVAPGADAAHLHEFFGNRSTNRNSTYESMIAAANVCNKTGDTAAYWLPSLFRADGTRIQPIRIRVYYSNEPVSAGPIVAFPPDLRIIAGYPYPHDPKPNSFYGWSCDNAIDLQPNLSNLDCTSRDGGATSGGYISARAFFPSCWDGVNTDSPDHRSHLVYPQLNGVDRSRAGECPSTHPIHVPRIRVIVHFPVASCKDCYLSSDVAEGLPGGTNFHVDFWNTWQQPALEAFIAELNG